MRFDDTNPTKEKMEFVDSIKEDILWLGADWKDHLYFASSYFDQMYECAVKLITKRKSICVRSDTRGNRAVSWNIDGTAEKKVHTVTAV